MDDEEIKPDLDPNLKHGPLPVVTPAGERAGMLPGIAGIGMFMLLVSMIGAIGALRGVYAGAGRYVVLAICTMVIVGVFGLLRLRRWGWALVVGGCLMMSLGYAYVSHATHNPALLVMAGFTLVFFLYLSRTEVRERLK
jgi:hypothetical protein